MKKRSQFSLYLTMLKMSDQWAGLKRRSHSTVIVEHGCKAKITLSKRKLKINLGTSLILQKLSTGRAQRSHEGHLNASQRKFPK